MTSKRARLSGLAAFSAALFAGDTVELRLRTEISSAHSKAGTYVQAVVIAPVEVDGRVAMPRGTLVHGVVRRVTRVGVGLVRERASIDLDFTSYELADGRRVPLQGHLASVDNSRETVQPGGRLRGILAANQPYSWMQGLWIQPKPVLFSKSLLGLTGVSGRLLTRFSLGPIGAAGLLTARVMAFRLPEPEIHLAVGTDFSARIKGLSAGSPSFDLAMEAEVPGRLSEWVRVQEHAVTKPGGQAAEDIVNLFFVGTEAQLTSAFAAAGWSHADPLNRKSLTKAYKAYTSLSGYASAPVSKLLLTGEEPAHVFQKSMNTLSKRHHVRLWAREFDGQTFWLGAATQDIGIAMEPRSMTFTHKIDPLIDRERAKIVNDLAFAGCTGEAGYVERPEAAQSGLRKGITTDGRAAVLTLGYCSGPPLAEEEHSGRPKSIIVRAARRTVLETRHYLLRGNAYYWGYRALRYRRAKPLDRSRSCWSPQNNAT